MMIHSPSTGNLVFMKNFKIILVSFISFFIIATGHGNKLCKEVENHPNLRFLPTDSCGDLKGSLKLTNQRIIGGTPVMPGEMPWMVLLIDDKGQQFCGGSMITKRHVLTAAHCTNPYKQTLKKINVRIGDHDSNKKNLACHRNMHRSVKLVIQHSKYNAIKSYHDIALLVLSKPVMFDDCKSYRFQPICLPTTCEIINTDLVGKKVTVAGWGNLYDGGLDMDNRPQEKSAKLQKLSKTVVKLPEKCPSYDLGKGRRIKTINSQICAIYEGNDKETKDACQGDSGGPLTYAAGEPASSKIYQVGIVSLGDKCVDNRLLEIYAGRSRMPGIYTKVSTHMRWILKHLNDA